MGVIQLPDELEQVIERQVRQGRAASSAAFLEEAVRRLVDDAQLEQEEIERAAAAGIADAVAGRSVTVATAEDALRMRDRVMARVRDRLVDNK